MIALSQKARVLGLLRERGDRGITAADFLLPDVVDGGKPIARLAARVDELRSRGLTIVTEGRRAGFSIYVLREERRVAAVPPPATEPAVLVVSRPRSAVLGWDDAA